MRFKLLLSAPVEVLQKFAESNGEIVTAMRKFSEGMAKVGVLLSAEGLHPTSKGTRLRVSGGKPVVTDRPFIETKKVIAGFWDHPGEVEGRSHRVGPPVPTARERRSRDSSGI